MTPASKTAAVQQYDLLDLAKAAQGAIELNKLHEKEAAASFIVNRIYGYLDPEHRAEFGEWVSKKGWLETRPKERIVLP